MQQDLVRRAKAAQRLAERELEKIAHAEEAEAAFASAMHVPSECFALPGYVKWERRMHRDRTKYESLLMGALFVLESLGEGESVERCALHGIDLELCYPGTTGCDAEDMTWEEFYGIDEDDHR